LGAAAAAALDGPSLDARGGVLLNFRRIVFEFTCTFQLVRQPRSRALQPVAGLALARLIANGSREPVLVELPDRSRADFRN
jgi:hypothetical protein